MDKEIVSNIFGDCPIVPLNRARALLQIIANAYDDADTRGTLRVQLSMAGVKETSSGEMDAMGSAVVKDALFGIQSLIDVASVMIDEERAFNYNQQAEGKKSC